MKILGSIWFTQMGGGLIGIVYGVDEVGKYKKYKAYIGDATGYDKKIDEQRIAERGATFPADVAKMLIDRRK